MKKLLALCLSLALCLGSVVTAAAAGYGPYTLDDGYGATAYFDAAYLTTEKKTQITEVIQMASSNRSNRVEVPEAKAAMDRFKTEVASELGVNLKEGYNGDLTSKEAGSIGGEMVRRMIKKQEESMK